MKIKLPPKKEEGESPVFINEDWGNVLLANEELAQSGKKIQDKGRLKDYSERELKMYFPDEAGYRNALALRANSMANRSDSTGNIAVAVEDGAAI